MLHFEVTYVDQKTSLKNSKLYVCIWPKSSVKRNWLPKKEGLLANKKQPTYGSNKPKSTYNHGMFRLYILSMLAYTNLVSR